MTDIATIQHVPVPEPQAHISTSAPDMAEHDDAGQSLEILHAFAQMAGQDICDMLPPGVVQDLGTKAVREWNMDKGSRQKWLEVADRSLNLAAQESTDSSGEAQREPLWEGAADIHYPILSTSSGQFLARAAPELIKGDKVVGVKVFSPPAVEPDPIDTAKAGPQPQNDQEAAAAQQQIQQAEQERAMMSAAIQARNARAERVKHFLNWLIFYQMPDWEGDSDLLLLQASIIGTGFKTVYMGPEGLRSEFLSATALTVHNDTPSLTQCPRLTQQFEAYPYEIENRRRAAIYRDVELPQVGEDPEKPRKFIQQHRLDDLDGDDLAEPYIVTVDVDTQTVMRVEPAYNTDDITIDSKSGKVMRIDRWLPFAGFTFLPDPRGKFYGMGLGQLLESITASIDTSINQLIDAGTAEIAGGGFIGSGVRLQGSGQGGSIFFRPGEYLTVSTTGIDLRQAIWERTVPHPSAVTMSMLELLLGAAKDIASIKDVITGEAPSTAPVGTTLALQNQALQVFSSIYKRIYRGFADEFRLMYRCLRRWATEREKKQYAELTNGDFDKDFSGDGTDIVPVADPTVVTKMQKVARLQTLMQMAESPVGIAAGMTQPQQAQEIMKDALQALDYDRPERFLGPVGPNPLDVAKAKETEAAAGLKTAQTIKTAAEAHLVPVTAAKVESATNLDQAKAVETMASASHAVHGLHVIADQIAESGSMQPPVPEGDENGGSGAA